MKMYEVGGCVRDELLGIKSSDIDFSVVLETLEISYIDRNGYTPFEYMGMRLVEMGFKIFLETPEFLTVRAQFPKKGTELSNGLVVRIPKDTQRAGLTADFVLARKESDYTDGRRPDVVVPGTLEDDLARRDFTMNAVAKAEDGSFIDPFNGRQDIEDKVIRAVGDPMERLAEDALRAVRALRFSVTKDFYIDRGLQFAMRSESVCDAIRDKISDERIQMELSKMFRFDTVKSLKALAEYTPYLTDAMFAGSVSLDATMKTKGRGK